MNKQLLSKLKKLAKENNIELKDILAELKQEERLHSETKMVEQVEANKPLVGKCFYKTVEPRHSMFPHMKRFYQVLSNRSENEYRVECLVFDEHPTYWFKYQAHKAGFSGDFYLGNFEFESFHTESRMANSFINMTEITKEEFDEHARKYLDEILNTHWVCDHYRYGGKLPTDPDWPQPEKDPMSFQKREDYK